MMADQAFSVRKRRYSDTESPSPSASTMSDQTSINSTIFESDTQVVNILHKLRANNPCDISLISNDGIVLDAHRLVLATSSDYFAPQPVQVNVDGATLMLILDYMYSGRIELNSRNVARVLNAAKQFQMEDLKRACRAFPSEELIFETDKDKLLFIKYSNSEHFKVFFYNSDSDDMPNRVWCPHPQTGTYGYSLLLVNHYLFKAGGKCYRKSVDSDAFECMDFSAMQWSALPPMLEKIQRPLMAETGGNVYISDPSNFFFHKFDSSKNVWQRKRSLAFTPYDMLGYNGLVYAVCDDIYHLQVYDPETNEWSSTAPRNNNIRQFRIAGLHGYVYAIGGKKVNKQKCSRKVERYCPSTDEWTVMKSLNTRLLNINCCAYNDRLIAYGTSDDVTRAEEYNPETDEWKEFPPLLEMSLTHFSYLATIIRF